MLSDASIYMTCVSVSSLIHLLRCPLLILFLKSLFLLIKQIVENLNIKHKPYTPICSFNDVYMNTRAEHSCLLLPRRSVLNQYADYTASPKTWLEYHVDGFHLRQLIMFRQFQPLITPTVCLYILSFSEVTHYLDNYFSDSSCNDIGQQYIQ